MIKVIRSFKSLALISFPLPCSASGIDLIWKYFRNISDERTRVQQPVCCAHIDRNWQQFETKVCISHCAHIGKWKWKHDCKAQRKNR